MDIDYVRFFVFDEALLKQRDLTQDEYNIMCGILCNRDTVKRSIMCSFCYTINFMNTYRGTCVCNKCLFKYESYAHDFMLEHALKNMFQLYTLIRRIYSPVLVNDVIKHLFMIYISDIHYKDDILLRIANKLFTC